MASLIDEHTQFTDSAGTPIVNGYLYVGTQNLDPVANPITIYSDRGLTTALPNPQRTDADGRTVNKIWVAAKYSLKCEDSNNIQKYISLDNGTLPQTGISLLTNVAGTNAITADGEFSITTLVDNQQYNFRAAAANTGAVTLQIELVVAKAIKKQHDIDLVAGDIEANQTISVIYNATDDVFELVSNVSAFDAVDATVSNDLTVTGNIVYGGEIQPVIPAQVTDHIRAGNIQIRQNNTLSTFDVGASISVGTWESIGPTDFAARGTPAADNLWADLDVVPTSARILICTALLSLTMTGLQGGFVAFYGVNGDFASPSGGKERGQGLLEFNLDPNQTDGGGGIVADVYIPCNAGQVSKLFWWINGQVSAGVSLHYKGFITD